MGEELLDAVRRQADELSEELPFAAYLERVRTERRLARRAAQLLSDTVREAGVETDALGRTTYRLFRDQLFGADDAIRQVVDYLSGAALGLDIGRRILLLVGPPGCGKSTLVNTLKAGLEAYTRTRSGAVYAIKDCPMHEDPLHLIPPAHRGSLGVRVEGDLCPHCRWLVREVYGGDIARVPVVRVAFDAAAGIGIGTFVATDPRSEDLTRLVGQVDLSLLEGPSRSAARRAFRLDGELNAANRGLADLVELFKMDERFLAALLTLSEERLIKLSGPGLVHADEIVIAQSNLAEYEAMAADPKASALRDRLVVVRMGYALAVRDEVRIYRKMLREADLSGAHLSPLALPAAASVAVLSRLERTGRASSALRRKLHLYDGRFVPDAAPGEAEALRASAAEEGLSGLSPRFVVNQLSNALASTAGCVSGLRALVALWDGLSQRAGFREEEREAWAGLFEAAREEHDDLVRRAVRRALVPAAEEAAEALARDAFEELERWEGGAPEPELPTIRRLEQALGIPGYRRAERRGIWLRAMRLARRTDAPLSACDGWIEEGVDRLLLPDWREAAQALVGAGEGPEAVRHRLEDLRVRLMERWGFCARCADDLLTEAQILARPRRGRRGAPRWLEG